MIPPHEKSKRCPCLPPPPPPPPRKTPTIDVVIPAYNAAQFIEPTLQSVLAQTLLPRKIIVVDDGSTDQTVDIVEGFQSERIELISVEHGGLAYARNLGIRASQADYIAFLDADDLWHVDKLKAQLEAFITNPEAKAAYSYALSCDEQGIVSTQSEYTNSPFPPGQFVQELLAWNNLSGSGSSVIVEAYFLRSNNLFFDEEMVFAEDFDLWVRMARHTDFLLVPWEHVFIRKHPSSMSRSRTWQQEWQWASDHFYRLNKHVKDYQIPQFTINQCLWLLNNFFFLKPYRIFAYIRFLHHLKRRSPDLFNMVAGNGFAYRVFITVIFKVLMNKISHLIERLNLVQRLNLIKRVQLFFSEGTIFFTKSKKYKQEQEKREFENRQ